MRRLVLCSTFAFALACSKQDPPAPASSSAPRPDPIQPEPTTVDPCGKAKSHGTLAWIEDDYPAAVACAKARNVPIVLDMWAPWCHTCLSMQSTVFTDKSFAADATRFVFAALDTDRESNAAAVGKFPLSAWPTFYVISPDETVLARFVGAASVEQFHTFLDTGARHVAGMPTGADAQLLAAERALQAKDLETADKQLTAALAAAPATWARRPDALVSLIGTKAKRKDTAGCLALAESSLDDTGNAASASDFMTYAIGCASEAVSGDGAKDKAMVARVQKLRERAVARWQKLVDDTAAPMSVDDRSDAMANLRETLEALGKKADAKAVAEKQRALLDATAAKAATPMAAMTYNWPRAEVYVYLGKPLDLVPALEKSAADLPKEYDPRARLGWIYLKAGKYPEATKWTDEALDRVYGPRKARVLSQRAEIANKTGDTAGEKRYREMIVQLWLTLPPGQQQPDALAKAKAAVEELDKPVAAH